MLPLLLHYYLTRLRLFPRGLVCPSRGLWNVMMKRRYAVKRVAGDILHCDNGRLMGYDRGAILLPWWCSIVEMHIAGLPVWSHTRLLRFDSVAGVRASSRVIGQNKLLLRSHFGIRICSFRRVEISYRILYLILRVHPLNVLVWIIR